MMSSRRSTGLTIVSSFVLLAACSVADYGKGRLIIAGSGLRADEAPIHLAFTQAAGASATILVLPTDTGAPGKIGPEAAQNLAPYAVPGQTVRVVELGGDAPEFGSDPQYVGELESAQAFWFTGSGQVGIVSVFRPESGDTPAYETVTRALKRGGVVAGTAAGAAMMSDPMIAWGNSQEALLVGARDIEGRAVALHKGMGFFPYGIVDPHFLAGGHLGRLVAALESTSDVRGYGVADDRALMVDIGRSHGTAIGAAAVVMVDISQLRRDGLNRFGLRLTLMGDQDGIALQSGTLIPAAGKTPLAPTGPSGDPLPLGPWEPDAVTQLIQRLARDPSREQRVEGELFTLVAAADGQTRFLARAGDLGTLSATGVRLDILAAPNASDVALQLLEQIGPPEGSR